VTALLNFATYNYLLLSVSNNLGPIKTWTLMARSGNKWEIAAMTTNVQIALV